MLRNYHSIIPRSSITMLSLKHLTLSLVAILASNPLSANAIIKGINFAAQNPNGACRTQDDWVRDFSAAKSAGSFTVARLYASSDCNNLANAVPAALQVGMQLNVGIWLEDDNHYAAEKGALISALDRHPNWQSWIYSISVGSEDLYRAQMTATAVAQKIYGSYSPYRINIWKTSFLLYNSILILSDVKGLLTSKGVSAPVGHTDAAW
jgi:exo-beta-1,3-glucanase (GH17 family)